MTKIIQGEQYALQFTLTNEEAPITPESCDDVKIKLRTIEKTHSSGRLRYDREAGVWLFPLTQVQTLAFCDNRIERQRQVKIGGNVYSTDRTLILVDSTIIKTVF